MGARHVAVLQGKRGGQTRLILIGAALLLALGMGIRQSLGLFLTPVTRDLGETSLMFMVHPTMKERDVRDLAIAVRKVMNAAVSS